MRKAAVLGTHLATLSVVLGLGFVHSQFVGRYPFTGTFRFGWLVAYSAALSACAYVAGIPDAPRSARSAALASTGATAAGALIMSAAQLLLGSLLLPRYVVFWAAIVLTPLYTLACGVARGGWRRAGGRDRIVVVAGANELAALEKDLTISPEKPCSISAAVEPGGSLLEAAERSGANVVVLDRLATTDPAIVDQAALLHERGLRIRTLSLFYEEWLGKLPVTELERTSMMFDIGALHRLRYARLRRVVDVIAGLVGIPVLLLITPFVAAGDLIANRGPLLYRQERIGRGGQKFVIVKFRTMRPDSDPHTWADKRDSRITPFGGFLRGSHLDELPQLWNVLRGELSIVGPRPEQTAYVEQLRRKIPFYDLRHLIRPGLTGWAQVKYGYSGDEVGAVEKLQYDFYYLRHQGVGLDLRILARTARNSR